jgi:hypothetical protein
MGAEIIKRAFVCVSVDNNNRAERERMCDWCQTLVGGSLARGGCGSGGEGEAQSKPLGTRWSVKRAQTLCVVSLA